MAKTNLVVKDNALINASYTLGLVEQRLVWLAILCVREQMFDDIRELGTGINYPIEITAESYCNHFGVHRNTAYEMLKDASKSLFQRQFSYQEQRKKGVANITSRWVSRIAYIEETACVEMLFSQDVIPLITFLEKHLTSYDLEQVKGLTSAYAIRLYELLVSWRSVGKTPIMPLEDLRNKIGVLPHEYERMHHFKARILDLAINQINEHTDITANYEQHKKGRTITGFTFKFKMKRDKKKIATEVVKRDVDNGDMFTIEGLSDKQLGRIARNPKFKTDYNHLVSPSSPANHSDDAWMYEMLNRFKKNPSQFDKRPIKDYLEY